MSSSTINSDSTLEEIWAVYDDNCGYDLESDVDQCKLFIRACRILLRKTPEEIEQEGGDRVKEDYHKIDGQLKAAVAWWHANDSSASTRRARTIKHVDLSNFRV